MIIPNKIISDQLLTKLCTSSFISSLKGYDRSDPRSTGNPLHKVEMGLTNFPNFLTHVKIVTDEPPFGMSAYLQRT